MEKKRILIIDDEVGATRLLQSNLEQTNDYVVLVENTATSALASAEHFKPDLVLLDVLMPGLDGGELAQRFQDRESHWAEMVTMCICGSWLPNRRSVQTASSAAGKVGQFA